MPNQGILFIAIGEKYLEEAHHAAARAARVTDLPISLVTHRDVDSDLYDAVIVDDDPEYNVSDKSANLLKSPYDETLFMDSDTYVVEEIADIFDCLERSFLAVTLDPHEGSLHSDDYEVDGRIPDSFPEYQTGVIVYRQTPIVENFVEIWVDNHKNPSYPDQLSFRETVYNHDIDIGVFPSRYNKLMANVVNGEVKILHDNNRNLRELSAKQLDRVLSEINDYQGVRIPYNSYSIHRGFGIPSRLVPFQISLQLTRHGYKGLYCGLRDLVKKIAYDSVFKR